VFLLNIIIMVVCGIIAAAIASSKGRSVAGWFFGGFFLSWIGIIIVAVLPNLNQQQAIQAHADRERHRLREQLRQERMKNEAFRQYTMGRLDEHDHQLGVDTRSHHPGLTGGQGMQALPPVHADESAAGSGSSLQQLNGQLAENNQQNTNPVAQNMYQQAAGENAKPVWYYEMSGQSVGPVTEDDIHRLLQHGQLDGRSLLWAPSLTDWTAAGQVNRFRTSVRA
jgi:hypothetical protein